MNYIDLLTQDQRSKPIAEKLEIVTPDVLLRTLFSSMLDTVGYIEILTKMNELAQCFAAHFSTCYAPLPYSIVFSRCGYVALNIESTLIDAGYSIQYFPNEGVFAIDFSAPAETSYLYLVDTRKVSASAQGILEFYIEHEKLMTSVYCT